MDKKAFYSEVIQAVKVIPIEEVAKTRLEVVKRGRNHKALCPFHNDEKVGSFVVGGNVNVYKCFSCGESGDAIDLISHLDTVSTTTAMFRIALENNILTKEQVNEFYASDSDELDFDVDYEISYDEVHIKDDALTQVANAEILDHVFSVFSEGNTLRPEGGKRLSDKHMKMLKEKRRLTDEEIERVGFFTFPDRSILVNFYNRLFEVHGHNPNILKDVPGFYTAEVMILDASNENLLFNKSEEEPDIFAYMFNETEGLGIPIRNAKGQIIGIQIRLDKMVKGGLRYIWFSSSWADGTGKNKEINGTASGAPKDVVYPERIRNSTLFITEGKFKALRIAKEFGSIAISMQGVSTWRGVEDIIEAIKDLVEPPVKYVVVAYDSDLAYNLGVSKQTMTMAGKIAETSGLDVQIALWDTLFGKGIDDMMDNGHKDKLMRLPEQEFKNLMKEFVKVVEEYKNEYKAKNMPKPEMESLFHKLILSNISNYKKHPKRA